MKSLGDHLKKYTKLGVAQKGEREVCREVAERVVGVKVDEKAVTIQNEVLKIAVPAPVKSKIRELKREILLEIRKKLGNRVKDVM